MRDLLRETAVARELIAHLWDSVAPLKDILTENPRILLVGINPSLRSEQLGHHFASPGNPFWRLLYSSAIVPVPLTFEDDARLPEFGLALTNLCSRATRSAAELRRGEIERGKRIVVRKIRGLRPAVVAFAGISIYRQFFPKTESGGAGPKPERICGARVFVLPNPSGLNASFPGFKDKLVWFQRLREFAAAHAVTAAGIRNMEAKKPRVRRSGLRKA